MLHIDNKLLGYRNILRAKLHTPLLVVQQPPRQILNATILLHVQYTNRKVLIQKDRAHNNNIHDNDEAKL